MNPNSDFPVDNLRGTRHELSIGDPLFPDALARIAKPPEKLYVLGDPGALKEGLAIIGARKASPYGLTCARVFSEIAAQRGVVIISGGALGCDTEAHRAALNVGGKTVVFLGGGCMRLYPRRNLSLFQEIVDKGGALVSEHEWMFPPLPYTFRQRNRLIAALAKATLIVEAGVPSGTFSTADDAIEANREVLAVPGSIMSANSRGANHLICQGATPIVDRQTFEDALFSLFGTLRSPNTEEIKISKDPILEALRANPMTPEELVVAGCGKKRGYEDSAWVAIHLAELQQDNKIARYPDGRYGSIELWT